jgi:hypothetical protein
MSVVPLRRIAPAIAAVIVLHALVVWWGFGQQAHTGAPHASAPVMLTRWLAAPAPPAELQAPARPAPPRGTAPGVRRAAAPAREVAATPSNTVPSESVSPAASELPTGPEPPLRTDGIQRAARESARHKGLAELASEQLGHQPVGAQAALRSRMASAARSDCLKGGEGGYAHSGLGLLALPLLVVDAASGRCR